MLNPAPSVQSRMNCGRMRLISIHAMVIVSGVMSAIQVGNDEYQQRYVGNEHHFLMTFDPGCDHGLRFLFDIIQRLDVFTQIEERPMHERTADRCTSRQTDSCQHSPIISSAQALIHQPVPQQYQGRGEDSGQRARHHTLGREYDHLLCVRE